MPSYCANLAAVSARLTQAQREFLFAWKEWQSAPADRRLIYIFDGEAV